MVRGGRDTGVEAQGGNSGAWRWSGGGCLRNPINIGQHGRHISAKPCLPLLRFLPCRRWVPPGKDRAAAGLFPIAIWGQPDVALRPERPLGDGAVGRRGSSPELWWRGRQGVHAGRPWIRRCG